MCIQCKGSSALLNNETRVREPRLCVCAGIGAALHTCQQRRHSAPASRARAAVLPGRRRAEVGAEIASAATTVCAQRPERFSLKGHALCSLRAQTCIVYVGVEWHWRLLPVSA